MLQGEERAIPAQAGETILEALLRAGVPFPFSCQTGNCGSCKCEHVSGEIAVLEHSAQALEAEERARGVILACRAQILTDVVVRLPDPGGR